MAVYNTFDEVVAEVKNKYNDVTKLSQTGRSVGCVYSHKINGVGCAIGCLLPNEIASELDNYVNATISGLYYSHKYQADALITPEQYDILNYIFTDIFNMNSIHIAQLSKLQRHHDDVDTVDEFLFNLTKED